MQDGNDTMRSSLELAITASETNIRAFATEIGIKESKIGPLAPRASKQERAAKGNLWVWQVNKQLGAGGQRPDDALRDFLDQHSETLRRLAAWRDRIVDVVVTIISEYEDNEFPSGYSFDPNTIALLKDFGATLEIDVVRQLT